MTLVLFLMVAVGSLAACGQSDGGSGSGGRSLRAKAAVEGEPGSGISGDVTFVEAPPGRNLPTPGVRVVARLRGLTDGRRQGFHIHEKGTCEPPFMSAGGHFDPGPSGNSNPDDNHPFHLGDLPNLEVGKGGIGRLSYTTSRVTLSPGPLSVFDADGSAVILHQDEDRGVPGQMGASGGRRVACGVIRLRREG
ncbi:MAG: superoxide dismutase family protein [Actinomycetota bacterium]|nr:superoxide dismutase family protein [Actinomycetota bacterium]